MPAVLQKRSLYPQVVPPVEQFSLYPLEMVRPRYMPVSDMRTVLSGQYHHRPGRNDSLPVNSLPLISVARSSFVRHAPEPPATLRRPKTFAAKSAVPENTLTPDYAERLLPRAPRIRTDTLPNGGPYSFLARKRKLVKPTDHGIVYGPEPPSADPRSPRDICSVTGRPFSRKRFLAGPSDNLIVAAFNGGAAGPTPNERRYLQLMLGTSLVT